MTKAVTTTLLFLLTAALHAGQIDTVAGNGDKSVVGQPFGVEIGPDGALYICEVQNHRVLRLELKTRKLTVIAGTGRKGYSGDGGPAAKAKLNEPYEVRFDQHGHMYFVEMKNHLIRRVDMDNGKISTVAGTGKAGFADGIHTSAQFSRPHSIAIDHKTGHLYVADIGNHRIRRINLDDGAPRTVITIAGNGKKVLPVNGHNAANDKPMLGPRALFIHKRALWIALREGHSVWKMNLDTHILQHVAGTGNKGYSGDNGPTRQATFNGPKGIAVGPKGHIYIVDTENQVIRKIDMDKHIVTTVAGNGQRGYGGDGGPATQAKMDRPHGVCVGKDGSIYIGDTNTHRVRRVRFE